MTAGIRHYRIELVDEQAQHVAPLLNHYHDLLTLCTKATTADASSLSAEDNIGKGNRKGDGKGDHNKRGGDNMSKGDNKRGDVSRRGVDVDIDAQVDVLWSFLEQLPNGHGVPQGNQLQLLYRTNTPNIDDARHT